MTNGKIGPFIGLAIVAALWMLWYYRVEVKNFFSSPPAPPPLGGTPPVGGAVTPPTRGERAMTWFGKYFLTIMLTFAGLVIFFWGIVGTADWSNLDLKTVGSIVTKRWLAVALLFGILAALIGMHGGASKKILFRIWTAVAVFLVITALFASSVGASFFSKENLVTTYVLPPTIESAVVQPHNFSMKTKAAEGFVMKFYGTGFAIHCVFEDGKEIIYKSEKITCGNPPSLAYQTVENLTEDVKSIPYEFVRIRP